MIIANAIEHYCDLSNAVEIGVRAYPLIAPLIPGNGPQMVFCRLIQLLKVCFFREQSSGAKKKERKKGAQTQSFKVRTMPGNHGGKVCPQPNLHRRVVVQHAPHEKKK